MNQKQIADPDLEVIDMVNDGVSSRRRVAENRALLHRMAKEQNQNRKAAWWREFRSMAYEAGAFMMGGFATVFAMTQGLIDFKVGVPVFVLCMVWTAVRIDRFVRKC